MTPAPQAPPARDWLILSQPTPAVIIATVAEYAGITQAVLLGGGRAGSRYRHLTMWLCRRLLGLSFPAVGRELYGRHHTTVMYGCARVQARVGGRDPGQVWGEISAFVSAERCAGP